MTLEDIEIAVEAELEEVLLPAAVLGQDLTGGPLPAVVSGRDGDRGGAAG